MGHPLGMFKNGAPGLLCRHWGAVGDAGDGDGKMAAGGDFSEEEFHRAEL